MRNIRLGAVVLVLATSFALPAFAQNEEPTDAPPEAGAGPAAEAAPVAPAPVAPAPVAPPSDGKFTFLTEPQISAKKEQCFVAAKATATRDTQRVGRNKCLADDRREKSRYKRALAVFKDQVAAFKTTLPTVPAGCRLTFAQGFQKWVTDFTRYAKTGGERVAMTPPPPSSNCK